jgi:DNA-binding PadR family transcriptional regulator
MFEHHHRHWGDAHEWPRFGPAMAGFFGPRAHHGDDPGWPRPPFGRTWRQFGRRAERLFYRGDMKYVVLDLLRERPRHGYDVIRALEERFHGLYSPSAGTVYPTLQLLEDQGYVSSDQIDGKRVYTLTEEGRKFLDERASTLDGIRARITAGWGGGHAETHALIGELKDLGKTLFQVASHGGFEDPERVRRLRAVIARAREEIEAILAGEPEPVREV